MNTNTSHCQSGINAPNPTYVKNAAEPVQHNGQTPIAPAPKMGASARVNQLFFE